MKELLAASELLYLSFDEVRDLDVFDFPTNARLVADAYRALAQDDVRMPSSDYLKYRGRPSYDRIIPLLGYVGGSVGVSGIKVVGSSTGNASKNWPRASALVVLNDPDSQRPFAVLEGSQISAARTAAVTSLAIEHLAPERIDRVAMIGCGYLARTHLVMWSQCFLDRQSAVHVYDLDPERIRELAELGATIGLELVPAPSAEAAIRDADVIIPLTTEEAPYIKAEWIKEQSLYSAVSLLDPELEVLVQADGIVVDDLDICLHEGRPLQLLSHQGRLDLDRVTTMGRLLVDQRNLRREQAEHGAGRLFFNPMGTVITDLALAFHLFQKARRENLGRRLPV